MKAKFEKGQRVKVTKKNGETFEGVINESSYNYCTFEREYDLDYIKDCQIWSLLCVPEANIEEIISKQ